MGKHTLYLLLALIMEIDIRKPPINRPSVHTTPRSRMEMFTMVWRALPSSSSTKDYEQSSRLSVYCTTLIRCCLDAEVNLTSFHPLFSHKTFLLAYIDVGFIAHHQNNNLVTAQQPRLNLIPYHSIPSYLTALATDYSHRPSHPVPSHPIPSHPIYLRRLPQDHSPAQAGVLYSRTRRR